MSALGATVRRRSLTAFGTTLIAVALASPVHAQKPPEANRFTRKILLEGIDEPIEIEFDKAGRVYFIERKGAVKRYDEKTGRVDVLGQMPIARVGEAGLIGLLLDRDFERTRQLYLYFSSSGSPSEMRLSRFTLSSRDSIDLKSEVVLMHWPYEVASHFGGGLTWDAQGNLYLTTGDNSEATQYNPVHWTNAGGKGQDSQRTSANSNDVRGKILRIHPEPDGSYTIPSGNLFPPGTPKTRAEIYTMGNRNPWRISIDSRNGFLHWGEVGPDAGVDSAGVGPMGYDEFNVASSAGNYGWPFFIGAGRSYNTVNDGPPKTFGGPMDPAHPVNRSPNNTGIRDLPPARPAALAYPYGVSEEWPMLGSGGRCAVGGPIFHASNFTGARRFPGYYEGKWFVVDFIRTWIMVATMSEDRATIVSMERFLPDEKYGSPVDMDFGPNGDLYIVEYGPNADGRLSKIEYNAGNRAPKVMASADRLAGATPLRVSLSSRGTIDDDGDALRYRWSVTGVGAARVYATATPVITLDAPGMYKALLTVTDRSGASSRDSVKLVAGNEPPRVSLDLTRGNRTFYFPGERVSYQVRASDREDGPARRNSVVVTADYVPSGVTPRESAGARELSPETSMRHLRASSIIARSDCMACHRTDTKLVGPAFKEVAQRYAGHNILETLAQKIITGGKGVWGEVVMPPHPSLTSAEATTLAQYVLSLSSASARPLKLPLAGSYTTVEHRQPHAWDTTRTIVEAGSYILRATYTDRGANGVPPIMSSSAVLLRHPLVAPETADSISAGITYNLSKGDPGFVIRRSGAHVAYRKVDLNGIGSIAVGALTRFYTWSHFKGATVEVHLDSANGPLAGAPVTIIPPVAKADPVVLGDNLEKPVTVKLDGVSGMHDVFFVFTNTAARDDDDLLLITGFEFKALSVGTTTLPDGFTPLFNGRDLTGWHVSRTTHQGTTPDLRVEDGAIVLRQHPYGQGGLLMTDRKYRNFELYLEAKPDSFTNGGIFLRSTEGGSAYQLELEGGGAGGTGSFFGEMLRVSTPVTAKGVQSVWRPNDWNAMRIRIEGDAPKVTLWINGTEIYSAQLGRNDLIGGRTDGMIALQSHWSATTAPVAGSFDMSGSWTPGAAHRFRNIGIKELPR